MHCNCKSEKVCQFFSYDFCCAVIEKVCFFVYIKDLKITSRFMSPVVWAVRLLLLFFICIIIYRKLKDIWSTTIYSCQLQNEFQMCYEFTK